MNCLNNYHNTQELRSDTKNIYQKSVFHKLSINTVHNTVKKFYSTLKILTPKDLQSNA